MPEPIRRKLRVEVAQDTPEKTKEPEKKVPEKDLPIWNFPLKQRSVQAKNLQEAEKKIKTKK